MGAAIYIDRTLATANAAEKPSFLEGLAGVEALARSMHNAAFTDLTSAQRDELLNAMENGTATRAFFNRVRRLTLEGMFCDPYYGGNKNFAGWDLIRYPGPRLAVAPEDQKMSTPPKPYRRSAYGNQTQTR
jgi:gluconate 2-dehydrogenase gamma chain